MKPAAGAFHRILAFHFVLFALCFVGGCSQNDRPPGDGPPKTGPAQPLHGGTYRIPLLHNPVTLDPAYVQDEYAIAVVNQIFESLVRFDDQLVVVPAIAGSWRVENQGRRYVFFLDPHARFHTGRPVTATDAAFSLRRLVRTDPPPTLLPHLLKIVGAEAYRQGRSDTVEGIRARDERTLEISLVEPDAPFLAALGLYQAAVVPEDEVARLGESFGTHPVGSGPFRFDQWEPDVAIRLTRVAGHPQPPLLDGVRFVLYPGGEITTAVGDFRAGNLEELPLFGSTGDDLAGCPGLQLFRRPSLGLLYYGMRTDHPVLKNRNFRKALSLAVNRADIVQKVYANQFQPASTILPPGLLGSRHSFGPPPEHEQPLPYLQAALRELTTPLPAIEIVSSVRSTFSEAELGLISESWRNLGLDVRVRFVTDWGEFKSLLRSDTLQVFRHTWKADIPDPDNFLPILFSSGSPYDFTRFHDPRVEDLLAQARIEADPLDRARLYGEAEARILDLVPVIPVFFLNVARAYQPYVKGIRLSALGAGALPLNRIWLDKRP